MLMATKKQLRIHRRSTVPLIYVDKANPFSQVHIHWKRDGGHPGQATLWGLYLRLSRVSELDCKLSKRPVFRLAKAVMQPPMVSTPMIPRAMIGETPMSPPR